MKHILNDAMKPKKSTSNGSWLGDRLTPRIAAYPKWFVSRKVYPVFLLGCFVAIAFFRADLDLFPENLYAVRFVQLVAIGILVGAWLHMERVIFLFQRDLRLGHEQFVREDVWWVDHVMYRTSRKRAAKLCRRKPWLHSDHHWVAIDAGSPGRPHFQSAFSIGPVEWALVKDQPK